MDVRAQIASVFHLDKCIGCHTCSVVCKNLWTNREGAEHMWWNNVEARPGLGYPRRWEDQETWNGGWEQDGGDSLKLRAGGRLGMLSRIFHNPALPTIDDYYEPWKYQYKDLFDAPLGDTSPSARPVSRLTGKPIDIRSGPNWDDDLAGSKEHAANDLNLDALTPTERAALQATERMTYFHLPRTCNHCANPACVAACPSGAIYKRGEDGLVVSNPEACRGWRLCVSSCPYKKVFFNHATGKSEKCIGCYPRVECGEAPACFASCVGRIRFQGVVLIDASRLTELASRPARDLVAASRELLLDPESPAVQAAARANGVADGVIAAARRSPTYSFVKRWGLALPLHPEFRTLPMVFYVPPLLPFVSEKEDGVTKTAEGLFATLENSRVPLGYLAALFTAGNEAEAAAPYRKLLAIRLWRRSETVGDVAPAEVERALAAANLTREDAAEIHKLTTFSRLEDRVVLPPGTRAEALEEWEGAQGGIGFARARV